MAHLSSVEPELTAGLYVATYQVRGPATSPPPSGQLTFHPSEGRSLAQAVVSDLYTSLGLEPGSYTVDLQFSKAARCVPGVSWVDQPLPEPRVLEVVIPELGVGEVLGAFRLAAHQFGLQLKTTRHLSYSDGRHGRSRLSTGFRAVFSDRDRNRLELATGWHYDNVEGTGAADRQGLTVDLAVGGKKLVRGLVPFEEWRAKLDLFCDSLALLTQMAALRRGLLNLKR